MKTSEIKNLKLSEKIRLYHVYEEHPLKSQYVKEKEALTEKLKQKYKITYNEYFYKKLIPAVLIVVYFIAFALVLDLGIDDFCPPIIILGLINLGVCYRNFISSNEEEENPIINTKEYIEFIEKYEKLGLIETSENDIFFGDCIEEDSYGNYICGATGQPLSYEQRCRCGSITNKEECSKCVAAVYGRDMLDNWSHEFKQ